MGPGPQEMLCKPDRGNWGTGKVTRRVPGCPEVQVGAQKHPWRAPRSRQRCLEGSGLAERLVEFPEVLEGPGRAPGCKGRQKENFGVQGTYSEASSTLKGTRKALGIHTHTHTHMEGGVGKAKCHLSTAPERAPGGLCWEDLGLRDAAQGRQRLLGHSHSHFHARGIPENTGSGALATGLWLSQAEKSGCVPGDEQQPVSHRWPSHALGAFPSVSESRAAAGGNHSSSFLPRAVFLPCLWQFCPGAGGGTLPSVGFSSLTQPKQCVLCASCHPLVVPVASEPPQLMQTPLPLQRREE